jgi:hypothetical protein
MAYDGMMPCVCEYDLQFVCTKMSRKLGLLCSPRLHLPALVAHSKYMSGQQVLTADPYSAETETEQRQVFAAAFIPGQAIEHVATVSQHTDSALFIAPQTYTDTITVTDLIQFNGVGFTWADFMTNLAAGTLYVNIHTAEAPLGLIRGQLLATNGRKNNVAVTCAVGKGWKYGK